jgi:hypothetical protein
MNNILTPDFQSVRHNINIALQVLYKDDHILITNNTSERAITHKLAEYIQPLFQSWHVDCEYNRLRQKPKAILNKDTTFPDIIIHHRGLRDNLLVIEAKNARSQNLDDNDDKAKIKAYIEDYEYQYKFGLWICFFDDINQTRMDWYENVNSVCEEITL